MSKAIEVEAETSASTPQGKVSKDKMLSVAQKPFPSPEILVVCDACGSLLHAEWTGCTEPSRQMVLCVEKCGCVGPCGMEAVPETK